MRGPTKFFMLMLATLAVVSFCIALFLAIAPLFFVEGTMRYTGTFQREAVKLVHTGRGRSRRVPAGMEPAFDMCIYDSNSTAVTTVTTSIPMDNSRGAEAIYYLPVWPHIYIARDGYNYGVFGVMALVFALMAFAFYLGASHFRKMTWAHDEEEYAREQESDAP